jgi:hypothetical protein
MLIFIGTLLMMVMTVLVGAVNGNIVWLADAPSLIFITIPLIVFLSISGNGMILIKYISNSFKKNYQYSKTELEDISIAIKSTIRFTLAVGGFAFIIGFVASLRGPWEEGGFFAANLSLSLISLLYSVGLSYFVLFPTQVWAENRLRA